MRLQLIALDMVQQELPGAVRQIFNFAAVGRSLNVPTVAEINVDAPHHVMINFVHVPGAHIKFHLGMKKLQQSQRCSWCSGRCNVQGWGVPLRD